MTLCYALSPACVTPAKAGVQFLKHLKSLDTGLLRYDGCFSTVRYVNLYIPITNDT